MAMSVYVTLREKECLRSFVRAIIKTMEASRVDETVMTASCFMPAFFFRICTGNVNFNRLLTVNTNSLNFIKTPVFVFL
jgi:hypothetical protein